VLEENERIVALCVLVVDEILSSRQSKRGPAATYFGSVMFHPLVAIHTVYRIMKCAIGKEQAPRISGSDDTEWRRETRTWIELIAVRPEYRGRGLGRILLDRCDLRTQELGRIGIGLRVASDNTSAKHLYEKCGYVCYQQDVKGSVYRKLLET